MLDPNFRPLKDPSVNTRIKNIDRIRTCYIMYKDIPICKLSEEYSELSGLFDWVFTPIWKNWGKCKELYNEYVDISGIDDTLHLNEYIRTYVPAFITQRVPPKGREDLIPKMREVKLDKYDLFEYLCRRHGVCGNDQYYVSRTPDIVINSRDRWCPLDIPEFDTDNYGWLPETINKST